LTWVKYGREDQVESQRFRWRTIPRFAEVLNQMGRYTPAASARVDDIRCVAVREICKALPIMVSLRRIERFARKPNRDAVTGIVLTQANERRI
jgi:hypothetical protein